MTLENEHQSERREMKDLEKLQQILTDVYEELGRPVGSMDIVRHINHPMSETMKRPRFAAQQIYASLVRMAELDGCEAIETEEGDYLFTPVR